MVQTWETWYAFKYPIGTTNKEVFNILKEKRKEYLQLHLKAGALVDKWFEFEKVLTPLMKCSFGSILGRHFGGGNLSEQESLLQINIMVMNALLKDNFKFIISEV